MLTKIDKAFWIALILIAAGMWYIMCSDMVEIGKQDVTITEEVVR